MYYDPPVSISNIADVSLVRWIFSYHGITSAQLQISHSLFLTPFLTSDASPVKSHPTSLANESLTLHDERLLSSTLA